MHMSYLSRAHGILHVTFEQDMSRVRDIVYIVKHVLIKY